MLSKSPLASDMARMQQGVVRAMTDLSRRFVFPASRVRMHPRLLDCTWHSFWSCTLRKLIPPALLCLFWLTSCFGQTPVTFRYFYYASGELFRVIDSTGTLIEYIIDPAGNVTQINRSTIAPGAPGILNHIGRASC